jgi:hypothetical protein
MAIVVEDGTGKTASETYISEADATAYLTARRTSTQLTAWTASSSAEKESALRLAAQYLDTMYKEAWLAWRYSDDQALDWPRVGLTIDNVTYDASEIPQQLIDATAELAIKVIDGDVLFADMADEGTIQSKTVRVGPITEGVAYAGGSRGIKRYRLVDAMISVLLKDTSQLERA